MIPNDVQGPGLLVELPDVAQRREQEDLSLYQLPRTRVVSKASAYTGPSSSRYTADAWYVIICLCFHMIVFFLLLFKKKKSMMRMEHLKNTENMNKIEH